MYIDKFSAPNKPNSWLIFANGSDQSSAYNGPNWHTSKEQRTSWNFKRPFAKSYISLPK